MQTKRTVFFFLFLSLLYYSENTYSNICSETFGKPEEKNHKQEKELQNSQNAKKVKTQTQEETDTKRKYPANSESLPEEIQEWVEILHSFETYSHEQLAAQERSTSYRREFDFNEETRVQLIDESLEHDPPEVSDFFKSHNTIVADVDKGRLLIASVKPSTNPTAEQRLKAKIKLQGAMAAKHFSLKLGNHFSLPLEFYTRMTKILILYMSRYLKENGVSHTVLRFIPYEESGHPDNIPNIKIQINPSTGSPLGRLATDFYDRYNEGHIIYDPFILMKLKSIATYSPYENVIIFSEPFFLDMDLKNPILLHELRHAQAYKDLDYTPDNPYHLLLLGDSLSGEAAYKRNIHFSEMITYQQDSRIHLRRVIASKNKNEANDKLADLIFSLEIGSKLNEEIEEKLSIALTFFNQTPEYFIKQSPIDLSTQTQLSQIKTPHYNITIRPEPNQTYTWLEVTFFAEKFILKISYENSVIRRANDRALQRAVKERLQLALRASIFHRRRYSIALAVAREAKETTDIEERTLLLRALQSSQILAQKFDPNRPEESLKELKDKIKSHLPIDL